MAKSTAFSLLNTLLVVGLLAAVATTVYNRNAISAKVRSLRGTTTQTATPSPLPTATPVVVTSPVTTPAPTAVPTTSSITEITPVDSNGDPLPRSGPELNLALAGIIAAAGGTATYRYSLRKRLKKTWDNITVR